MLYLLRRTGHGSFGNFCLNPIHSALWANFSVREHKQEDKHRLLEVPSAHEAGLLRLNKCQLPMYLVLKFTHWYDIGRGARKKYHNLIMCRHNAQLGLPPAWRVYWMVVVLPQIHSLLSEYLAELHFPASLALRCHHVVQFLPMKFKWKWYALTPQAVGMAPPCPSPFLGMEHLTMQRRLMP